MYQKYLTALFLYITIIFFTDQLAQGELSQLKCKEYSRYAPNSTKCNLEQIPEDNFAAERNFPHVAMLGYKSEDERTWLCLGSLISDEFIIVPAHCLSSLVLQLPNFALLGVTNLNSSEHSQEINITRKIVHPEYKPPSYYNDIGLVKLEKKVVVNEHVRPICLYIQTDLEKKSAIASGWGYRERFGVLEKRLLEMSVNLHDQSKCNNAFRESVGTKRLKKGFTSETMLCVGSKSSGPFIQSAVLQILSKDYPCMYVMTGMGSFGKLDPQLPSVYSRISAYISWIEREVWKEN